MRSLVRRFASPLIVVFAFGCAADTGAPRTEDPDEEEDTETPETPRRPDARPASSQPDAPPSGTKGPAVPDAGPDIARVPDQGGPAEADARTADAAFEDPDAPGADAADPGPLKLESVWVRLADTEGKADQDPTTESAESAEFSPDEKFIASGSKGVDRNGTRRGQRVSVWRVEDGSLVWERPRANEVEAVSFSRDGKFIAAGGEDFVTEILDATNGRLVTSLRTTASIDGLRFSRDGKLLAVGTEAQLILLYRTTDWKLLASIRHGGSGTNAVNQIDFTSDDRILVSAGTNAQVKVWEVKRTESGGEITAVALELRRTLAHKATVKSVRISPDDRLVASGSGEGNGTLVHELATGRQVAHIAATAWTQECLEWTPDGRFLVTGGSEGNGRGSAEQLRRFPANGGFGSIRFYRVPAELGKPFELAHAHKTFRQEYYDFTKDGRLLVSSHEDGTIRLWRVSGLK